MSIDRSVEDHVISFRIHWLENQNHSVLEDLNRKT